MLWNYLSTSGQVCLKAAFVKYTVIQLLKARIWIKTALWDLNLKNKHMLDQVESHRVS